MNVKIKGKGVQDGGNTSADVRCGDMGGKEGIWKEVGCRRI